MADKPYTRYSTNPKMDTSGISGSQPVYGKLGMPIGVKVKPGGELYKEAVSEQADEYGMRKTNALTTSTNMRAAAKLVDEGYSCDHAFDIVGRDTMYMPDRVDMVKAAVKAVKKSGKGY